MEIKFSKLKLRKILLLLTMQILFLQFSIAQLITGNIVDIDGNSIVGVNIIEKGTTNGTITGLDGSYSMELLSTEATIVYSAIGYQTTEISFNGQKVIDLTMLTSEEEIDEIVVVGYGTMKKKDLTGSISSVDVSDVNEKNISTVDQVLQGRSAGVYVNTSSRGPGGVLSVRIRGANSLSNSNEPLYVLDGIPIEYSGNEADVAKEGYITPSNPLIGLKPQDIESIEILKDASATAIYGSRGANGVVIITTKSGLKGKPKINVSTSVSVSNIVNRYQMLSGLEYIQYRNEAELNSGGTDPYVDLMKIHEILQPGETVEDYLVTHDWIGENSRTALGHQTRISINGGSDKSNYYLAGGYDNLESVINNSGAQNYNFRANYKNDVTKWLKFSSNFNFTQTNLHATEGNGYGGTVRRSGIRSLISYPTFLTSENPQINIGEGQKNSDEGIATPAHWVNEFKDDTDEKRFIGSISLRFKINKIFSYEVRAGINYRNKLRQKYFPKTLSREQISKAVMSTFRGLNYNIDNLLYFNKKFDQHNLDGTIGFTYQKNDFQQYAVQATGFPDDAGGYNMIGSATESYPSVFNRNEQKLASFLARVNYSFMDRYLLTVSGRADGSSKFVKNNKWGYFPSIALAWRASEEDFIKNLGVFYNLKARVGWGMTGNQSLPPYSTKALYNNGFYGFNDVLQTSYYSDGIANEELTWETTSQYNAGIDIGFMENRISLTVDAYQKSTSDCLLNFALPTSSGYSSIWRNFGEIENKGIELSANFVILNSEFKWELGGNIAFNKNKISRLGLPVSDYGYVQYWGNNIHNDGALQQAGNTFIEGQPIGLFWGYKTDGVYQNEEEIADGIEPLKELGDIRFVDVNGDGVIDVLDQTILGDPNPDFTYGINTSFSYKGIFLSLFINGVAGKDILNANLYSENSLDNSWQNIRREAWYGRWQGEGSSNYYQRAASVNYLNDIVTDRLIEDASFIRLQNLTIGYEVPIKKLTKVISKLSVYITGTNLFVITDYSGFDPEVDSFSWDNSRIGIDNNSFPNSRTFTFGLNIGF